MVFFTCNSLNLRGSPNADTMPILIITTMASLLLATFVNGDTQELCNNEVFEATCAQDEIITMTEAKYGRMRVSRCVKKNYGYVGCYNDVLGIADDMCSGRHQCSIPVPNERFDAVNAKSAVCPEDFKSYFNASYTCTKVLVPPHGACRPGTEVLLTEPEGVISNVVASATNCVTGQAPWVLQVKPGQRIRLTLLDFSYGSPEKADGGLVDHTKCYLYAVIRDARKPERMKNVCGERARVKSLYTSLSNKLNIVMYPSNSEGEDELSRHFAIKYEAVGCADPSGLMNGWFRRHGDTIEVGCNDSTDSYTATCNGTRWDREIKNCSVLAASKGNPSSSFIFSLSYEVAIVIILAIALVIASAILCIGVVCMRRFQEERSRQYQQHLYGERTAQYHHPPPPHALHPTYMDHGVELEPPHKAGATGAPCVASYEQYRTGENIYASIQENLVPLCSGPPGSVECNKGPTGGPNPTTTPSPLHRQQQPYFHHHHNHGDACTCANRDAGLPPPPRDHAPRAGTGSGPYSSLEPGCTSPSPPTAMVTPEAMCSSPTNRSQSSIFADPPPPAIGRPYYVLDPRDSEMEQ